MAWMFALPLARNHRRFCARQRRLPPGWNGTDADGCRAWKRFAVLPVPMCCLFPFPQKIFCRRSPMGRAGALARHRPVRNRAGVLWSSTFSPPAVTKSPRDTGSPPPAFGRSSPRTDAHMPIPRTIPADRLLISSAASISASRIACWLS